MFCVPTKHEINAAAPKNMMTGIHIRLALGFEAAVRGMFCSPLLAESQTAGKARTMPAHWPKEMWCMPSINANANTGMAMESFEAMVATDTPNSCEQRAVRRKRG